MTLENVDSDGIACLDAAAVAYEPGPTIPSITGTPPSARAMLDHLRSFENGTFTESFNAVVTEDGGVVTMSLEQAGGGDLTMNFSDAFSVFAATPAATITLTAGTVKIPKKQYVYILQSDRILAVSDSGWPAAEHIKVAFAFVPSAAFINTYGGVYSNQNHNDHAEETAGDGIGQGHMTDLSARSRRFGAIWLDGCEGIATQDSNDLWVSVAAGDVMQMHPHTFTALDSDAPADDPILVVNGIGDEFAVVHSLNEITKHSDGSDIGTNKYVKFVLWAAANKTGELSPMFLNLPSGEYNSTANALKDVDGKSDFTLPAAFGLESSTGFLIAAFICKHTASGMILQDTVDLRGTTPATAPGSGTGGGDVSASAALADNAVIRGDGGAKDVQDSGVLIDDSDNMSGIQALSAAQIANLAGALKIQPDAEGNVLLFGDTDVDDAASGRILYVYRKAAEGDTYLRLYISAAKTALINADTDLFIDANGYIKLVAANNIYLDLGDNAGAQRLRIRDSDKAEVAAIDSNGNFTLDGTVDGVDIAAHAADITDPHGAIMSVSTSVVTPIIRNFGNLFIDAYNAGAASGITMANTAGQGFTLVVSGDLSLTGDMTLPSGGTVDGRDIDADGTKLDTIETSADVTDATNVDAALPTKLRTVTKIIYVEFPIVADSFPIAFIADDITMVQVRGVTSFGTVDFNIEYRNTNTPDVPGTDTLTSDLPAVSAGASSTTFDNNGDVPAETWLTLTISGVTTTTKLWVAIEYTID